MIKYQSTDDIWGFTWAGRRKESDYDTSFALNDKVKMITKDTPFSSLKNDESVPMPRLLLDSECDADSDQNLALSGKFATPSKSIRFNLDATQRMRWYVRYPAYTVVQGISRAGGLLAILNIVGIICIVVH